MTECNRTLLQARRDRAAGLIKSAAAVRVPMTRGEWMIGLQGRRGDEGWLLDAATLEPMVFKSLDRVVASLEEMGFAVSKMIPA
jgi:hypothetical protein